MAMDKAIWSVREKIQRADPNIRAKIHHDPVGWSDGIVTAAEYLVDGQEVIMGISSDTDRARRRGKGENMGYVPLARR